MRQGIILALLLSMSMGGCGKPPVITPPPQPPPVPHFVTMQWDDVCAELVDCTYEVYRGSNPQALMPLASTNVATYVDSKVQGGQTYYYAVTSQDSIGESDKSNIVSTGVPQ